MIQAMLCCGLFIIMASLSIANPKAIKRHYSDFIEWCVNSGNLGLCVYGGVCGVIVLALTFPWA